MNDLNSNIYSKVSEQKGMIGYLGGDNVASSEDINNGFGQSHLVDELVRHFSLLSFPLSLLPAKTRRYFWGQPASSVTCPVFYFFIYNHVPYLFRLHFIFVFLFFYFFGIEHRQTV